MHPNTIAISIQAKKIVNRIERKALHLNSSPIWNESLNAENVVISDIGNKTTTLMALSMF